MGEKFIVWEMLTEFATFVAILYMIVGFTKDLPLIRKIRTKYYACVISFIMLILINLHFGTFEWQDTFIYLLSSIVITYTTKGVVEDNKQKKVNN